MNLLFGHLCSTVSTRSFSVMGQNMGQAKPPTQNLRRNKQRENAGHFVQRFGFLM